MEKNKKQIALILATAREGRQSIKPFEYLFETLNKRDDVDIVKVDVKHFNLNKTVAPWIESNESKDFKAIAKKVDAFIIVVPEYNHSFPGELKLLLDQATEEYTNKPALVAGVSSGNFGGARVVESLIPVISELGMNYIAYPLYFSKVEEIFELKKEELDAKYQNRINKSIEQLLKRI